MEIETLEKCKEILVAGEGLGIKIEESKSYSKFNSLAFLDESRKEILREIGPRLYSLSKGDAKLECYEYDQQKIWGFKK